MAAPQSILAEDSLRSPPTSSKDSSDIDTARTMHPTVINGALTPPPDSSIPPISTLEICIAHYNEDLSWLSSYTSNCSIYSKGESPANRGAFANAIRLPNIGRETHTYLTHIVRNYDSLPHVTLFLQGNIHDINDGTPAHTDLTLPELFSTALALPPASVLPIGIILPFSSFQTGIPYKPDWVRRRGATLVRSPLSPAAFWTQTFAGTPDAAVPQEVKFVQGACYAVTKEALRGRPREWWARLLAYFEGLGEMNPEEGHYMERMWYAIFAPDVAIHSQSSEGKGR